MPIQNQDNRFVICETGQEVYRWIIETAVEDAKKNAERNGITNATMWRTQLKMPWPSGARMASKPDVIIVDPPRKGLTESFIKASVAIQPEKTPMSHEQQWRDIKLYQELGKLKKETTGFFSWRRTTWSV